MTQNAKVVEIKPDGRAVIETKRKSACDHCAARNEMGGDCGGIVCAAGEKSVKTEVLNKIGARVGDKVMVESDNRWILLAALLVFIVPIVIAFAVYAIVAAVLSCATELSELNVGLIAAGAALVMTLLFFLSGKLTVDRLAKKHPLVAITEIIEDLLPSMVSQMYRKSILLRS